jgi:hypothetical protein
MVRLLLFALVGAAVWYGWRAFRRQQDRVNKALWEAEASLAKKEPIKLEKDPETGIYRPTDRRD